MDAAEYRKIIAEVDRLWSLHQDEETFRFIDRAIGIAASGGDGDSVVNLAIYATLLTGLVGIDWGRTVPYYKLALQWDPENREALGAMSQYSIEIGDERAALDYLRRCRAAWTAHGGGSPMSTEIALMTIDSQIASISGDSKPETNG